MSDLTPAEAAAKYRSLEYRGLGNWYTPDGELLDHLDVTKLRVILAEAYLEEHPADDEEAITEGIEILDMEHTESYVFRVVRMEQGCCKESLPCRVELGPKGFTIAFYGPHGLRDAKFGAEPLSAIPVDKAELVGEAIKQAAKLQDQWLEKLQSE